MTIYTINGQALHAHTQGHTHAPVALLVHGWSSSWYTWKPLLPALSQRFFCIAVDLPGYGQSPPFATETTIAGYAATLLGLIEQVSDRAVLVLGHSMGGQIAMTMALRYAPMIERMVLLNPVVSGRLSSFINLVVTPHIMLERFRWGGKLLEWVERTPLSYTDHLLKPISFAERALISPEDYTEIRAAARRPGQGRVRADCLAAMRNADLRGKLYAIQAPSLVLWGAEDNTVPLRDAGSIAAEWPQADLRLIPNASHWPQFEQFPTTLRHISSFLGLPHIAGVEEESQPNDEVSIAEISQFLFNSDLGHALNATQRVRLAAQLHAEYVAPEVEFAAAHTRGDEMYLVQQGTVEVWATVNAAGVPNIAPRRIAAISAGQVVGEMALLEDGVRSAALRAGAQGVRILVLSRRRFEALCQDDPDLGLRVMQNLARSLSLRLRLQNWQLQSRGEEQREARSENKERGGVLS